MKINTLQIVLFLVFFIILSCKKESFYTEGNARLSFSNDTVMFDTVFTSIGSTTKQLKVHNPYKKSIKISSIYLAGGTSSNFRLNINGTQGNSARNVEIAAKDSMYIFVEVTVNPNNLNTPMVISDSVIFVTNGNPQNIKLVAWGQNVNLVNGQIFRNDTVWTSNRPFLIYNSMLVDSLKTLTIQQGTKLYFHNQSKLYVKGTLVVNGTLQQPVYFLGDRLEQAYKNIPGQWGGIFLVSGSKSNYMDYAIVRNAIIGIQSDTLASLTSPTLTILNSKIENMSGAGIFAQGSSILAANCVIDNCNDYGIDLNIGGSYEFYNCTIADYYEFSTANTPAVNINNWYQDVNGTIHIRPVSKAYFGNCIIYGTKDLEIGLDSFLTNAGSYFNFTFDHCLLKVNSQINTSNTKYFKANVFGDPDFKDENNYDYSLDTLSAAINKGDINIVNLYPQYLDFDINNISRTTFGPPDIGAYERKNQKHHF